MGRNVKPGISFYRMDSGHILNKKVRLLYNEFGSDGYYIWCCLLDYGYGKWGYYIDMNDVEEFELFASEYCKKSPNLIKEVINGCIRRSLFDKGVFDSFNILTSEMMQEVFIYATAERRRKGSIFELQSEWLVFKLDSIPVNIRIVHGSKEIFPVKIPQTKQNNTETKRDVLAPEGATQPITTELSSVKPRSESSRMPGPKFIPPTLDEVIQYFTEKLYKPKEHGSWMPDRCRNEALKMFNHYDANGWVQGKNKPIKKWKAACNTWILNCQSGIYSAPNHNHSPAPAVPTQPVKSDEHLKDSLSKVEREINYLFEKYSENPESVTTISIEVVHYNHLKQTGRINFSDDMRSEIEQNARRVLTEKQIAITDDVLIAMMKKIAVIEYFKLAKTEAISQVYV